MDPACPGIAHVRKLHGKRQSLVRESMKKDDALRKRFEDAEAADMLAHLAACDRCHTFDETHRCPVCRLALVPEVGGELCTSGWHKFKRVMGWIPKPKGEPQTDASEPQERPSPAPAPAAAQAPTSPPPAAQPQAPPPRSTFRTPKPPAPRTKAAPARTPPPRPPKAPTPPPAPVRVRAIPTPPPPPPRVVDAAPAEPKAREPHEVLGVARNASGEEVRNAFREKAKNYHPDRVAHMAPEFKALAEKHMLELNMAYDAMRKRAQALEKSGSA